jgi:hypothetical protein
VSAGETVNRAAKVLIAAGLLVGVISGAVYLATQAVGLKVSPSLIVVGVSALFLRVMWVQHSRGANAPQQGPVRPPMLRRRTTWDDASAAARLHREGVITREQLDEVLRAVMPERPPQDPRRKQ